MPQSSSRHQSKEHTIASISLLQILQLHLARAMVLEKYAIGYYLPSRCYYKSTLVITLSNTSVLIINYNLGLQQRRISKDVSLALSSLKVSQYSFLNQNRTLVFISRTSSFTITLQLRIKCQQKLQKLRKDQIPLTVVGTYYS